MNRIFIADDDYAIRLLYEEELTFEGYEVIASSDCEDILNAIAHHEPELVVLHIK